MGIEWNTADHEPKGLIDCLVRFSYPPNGYGYAVCTWLGHEGIDGVFGWSVSESDRRNGTTITHWAEITEPLPEVQP